MKKIIATCVLFFCSISAMAESNYGGMGLGYSEACRTKYSPGFAGGDCIEPNLAIRGFVGHEFNDFFSLEGTFDFSFDGGHISNFILDAVAADLTNNTIRVDDTVETRRWAIATIGVAALVHLPITNSIRLYAGPTLGGSVVSFDYDVQYFGNSYSQNTSESEFGLNYGAAAGVEILMTDNAIARVQWQNWRSLDANVATNGEFNSNTFTINIAHYF